MHPTAKWFELKAQRIQEKGNKNEALFGEISRRIGFIQAEMGKNNYMINLEELANHLGISSIREVPLAIRGRLIQEKREIILEVNFKLPFFQKRHTIAHEIAHIIIEGKDLNSVSNKYGWSNLAGSLPYFKLEQLCDKAANEILLPKNWLREKTSKNSPSINIILEIKEEKNLPLDFIINQILENGLWNCGFYWWREVKNRVECVKLSPLEKESVLYWVKPCNDSTSLIRKCFRTKKYVEGYEAISIFDETYKYRTQCIPNGNGNVISMHMYSTNQ